MKRLLVISVAIAVVGLFVVRGQTQPNQVGDFMRAKLVHSQKVLEGLTTEDFEQIAKHSQELSLLSQAATWQVLQTPEYKQQSTEFRRAVDGLTRAAEKKNLDGAALAYVDVTLKCISCHKYVRGVRMAQADAERPFRLSADAPRVGPGKRVPQASGVGQGPAGKGPAGQGNVAEVLP